jgi:hypothetical protein
MNKTEPRVSELFIKAFGIPLPGLQDMIMIEDILAFPQL